MSTAFFIQNPQAMDISDEKLRQIVRETLRELGPEADPALVRKVVREVVRHLQRGELTDRPSRDPALSTTRANDKTSSPSRPGY